MSVIFHYRAGHEKLMAERYAKLLQRMGHGYYRTEEPEPVAVQDPVVVSQPVVLHDRSAEPVSNELAFPDTEDSHTASEVGAEPRAENTNIAPGDNVQNPEQQPAIIRRGRKPKLRG